MNLPSPLHSSPEADIFSSLGGWGQRQKRRQVPTAMWAEASPEASWPAPSPMLWATLCSRWPPDNLQGPVAIGEREGLIKVRLPPDILWGTSIL